MELILIYILLPLLGSWAAQVFLLRKVPVKPLHFLLPLGAAAALARAIQVFRGPHMFGGLDELEGIALIILALSILLGWGAGWLVNLWLKRK